MAARDQAVRKRALKSGILAQKVDIANTARLKQIIAEYGWPTASMVGKKASYSAWLLAQHADLDLDFQKSCLQKMRTCHKREPDKLFKECIEHLEERVRYPLR